MVGDAGLESDSELEAQARAQADAIARSEAAALAAVRERGSAAAGGEPLGPIQMPGRELLLWHLRQTADLATAWPLAFQLLGEPRFVGGVPANRSLPLFEFKAQRQWAQAVTEWNRLGGGEAETWIRCDRRLVLRRDANGVKLTLTFRDVVVQFDPEAKNLVPQKVDGSQPVGAGDLAVVREKLPTFGPLDLAEALRAPTRALTSTSRRGDADAYVRGGMLMPNLEMFLHDKRGRKKDEPQDAGRGFLTWLSGLVKNQGGGQR